MRIPHRLTSAFLCAALLLLTLPASFFGQVSTPGISSSGSATPAAPAKPLFRDPVHDGAADPVLIWDRNQLKWVMFYTNRRADQTDLSGVRWVHGTRISIAESTDAGATWRYAGVVDLPYGDVTYTHWAPDVFEWQGTYHMYLSVVPGTFDNWDAAREIVHFSSTDLRQWQSHGKLSLGSDRVIDASVIPLPAGGFRMWYKDERAKDGSIYYADSPDLYRWHARGVALPSSRGEGAKVFRWRGRYWLIIDAWEGLAVHSSTDCLNWQRQPKNILQEPGNIPTDRGKGQHADVVVSGDRAYIIYFVHQGGPDAEGHPPGWERRTVLQVAELTEKNGHLQTNRNQPVIMSLSPNAGRVADHP